jgi:phosphohistidine phosphatase
MTDQRLIYIVRHGIAEDRGPKYPDDSQRPLTAEGKDKLKEIAAGLVELGVAIDEFLTSPFLRARETADVLAAGWHPSPPVIELAALAVGGRAASVFSAIAARDGARHVALVGHMPSVGRLAADLAGASREFDFKKGAVACFAVQRTPAPGAGTLLWFAPPRLLRARKK